MKHIDSLLRKAEAWEKTSVPAPDQIPPLSPARVERILTRTLSAVRRCAAEGGTDAPTDTEREVHPIMAKRPNFKRSWLVGASAAAAAILLIAGLWFFPRRGEAEPGTDATSPNSAAEVSAPSATDTGWRIEPDIEPDVQAAIDARASGLFWKVDPALPDADNLALWSFRSFDCRALWPELRAAVFPDATDTAPAEETENFTRYRLEIDGKAVWVDVGADFIQLDGEIKNHRVFHLKQKVVLDYVDRIQVWFAARTDLELVPWDGPIGNIHPAKAYTLSLDGLPVNPNTSHQSQSVPSSFSGLFAWRDGYVSLTVPIEAVERTKALHPDGSLTGEDLRLAAALTTQETVQTAKDWTVVDVLRNCSLTYGLDLEQNTILPIYTVTGKRYVVIRQADGTDSSEIHELEYRFNAITGELLNGKDGF
ncbi:MAG: hypothetical protein VZQ75_08800 [Candidatus Faecousia sp.]|nr:hypothetical protein [Candidatus Faecousia sp.]